jgi:predicted GNAT family N-acyltransferase
LSKDDPQMGDIASRSKVVVPRVSLAHKGIAGSAAAAATDMLQVRSPQGEEEMEQYYDLRWRILREPWAQSRGGERDEQEVGAVHLGAWMDGKLVGVGRLHLIGPREAQIRYMAVETAMQGCGVGARILSELERRAQAAGVKKIVLNARDRAVHFYQRHGYLVTCRSGVLFDVIPHWQMQKKI